MTKKLFQSDDKVVFRAALCAQRLGSVITQDNEQIKREILQVYQQQTNALENMQLTNYLQVLDEDFIHWVGSKRINFVTRRTYSLERQGEFNNCTLRGRNVEVQSVRVISSEFEKDKKRVGVVVKFANQDLYKSVRAYATFLSLRDCFLKLGVRTDDIIARDVWVKKDNKWYLQQSEDISQGAYSVNGIVCRDENEIRETLARVTEREMQNRIGGVPQSSIRPGFGR
jgi:hypothetical protein